MDQRKGLLKPKEEEGEEKIIIFNEFYTNAIFKLYSPIIISKLYDASISTVLELNFHLLVTENSLHILVFPFKEILERLTEDDRTCLQF